MNKKQQRLMIEEAADYLAEVILQIDSKAADAVTARAQQLISARIKKPYIVRAEANSMLYRRGEIIARLSAKQYKRLYSNTPYTSVSSYCGISYVTIEKI